MQLFEAYSIMRHLDSVRELEDRMTMNESWDGCGAIVESEGYITHIPAKRYKDRKEARKYSRRKIRKQTKRK